MSKDQKTLEWQAALLQNLARVDNSSADFFRSHSVKLSFWRQGAHVSAIWTLGRWILLNKRYYSLQTDPAEPLLLSVLIHEIRHLQQGFFAALSVYGELEAWQLGFRVYRELTGLPYHPKLVEFMTLPLGWDRDILRRAQNLMQEYAGKNYRADLLPLYPWGREIKYKLGVLKSETLG